MTAGAPLAVLAVARDDALCVSLPPDVRVLADGDGLAALCVDQGRVMGGLGRLRLVQAIEARLGTLLPVAAGCATPAGVRAWLRAEGKALSAGLTRVAGCSEIVLTVPGGADRPAAPGLRDPGQVQAGGRTWLRARAADARAAAAARDRLLHAALARVAAAGGAWRAARADPFGHPVRGVDIVLLVPSGSAARLARRLADPGAGGVGAGIAVTGPWPCYSFGALGPPPPGVDAGAAA